MKSFADLRAKHTMPESKKHSLSQRMHSMATHMLTRIETAWEDAEGDWNTQEKLIQIYIKLSAAVQKIPEPQAKPTHKSQPTSAEDKAIIEHYLHKLSTQKPQN